jgi:hypothetical protein
MAECINMVPSAIVIVISDTNLLADSLILLATLNESLRLTLGPHGNNKEAL